MKLKLTAKQTEDLPFPVGCPVWYNFPEKSSRAEDGETDKEKLPPLLKQGVVESVSFSYGAKDMVYEVVYKDDNAVGGEKTIITEEVSERKLAYAANCPVTISTDANEGDIIRSNDGTILLCEPSPIDPGKFCYMVMIWMNGSQSQARFESGIDAKHIKYRKEATKIVGTNDKATTLGTAIVSSAAASDKKEQPLSATDDNGHAKPKIDAPVLAVHASEETMPLSSITCGSIAKSSSSSKGDDGGTDRSNKRKRTMSDMASLVTATPRGKSLKADTTLPATKNNAHYKYPDSRRSVNSYSRDSIHNSRGTTDNHETGMEMNINPREKSLKVDTTLPNTNNNAHYKYPVSRRSVNGYSRDDVRSSRSTMANHETKMEMIVTPRGKSLKVDVAPPNSNSNAHYKHSDSRGPANSYSHDSVDSSRGMMDNHETTRMEMKIPMWLQRDLQSQRDLFFHLVGSKHKDKCGKRTVDHVASETGCHIAVNFNNASTRSFRDNIRNIPAATPISIAINAGHFHSTSLALRALDIAREKILELLLNYMDVILDDNSKGRLMYEVSSSCRGGEHHHPKGSTSRAVRVSNNGDYSFLSLVELPYSSQQKRYHAFFLLHRHILVRMKERDCTMRVCGDDFRMPLKFCNPHVVVRGRQWENVDRAVGIVEDAIGKHLRACPCVLR